LTVLAPSAPPQSVHGEAVDSTSIRVAWSPPPEDHQNGVIKGYRVLYAEANSNDDDVSSSSVSIASVPPNDTWYVVRGLRKWTLYSVWVLAFTEAGEGPRSDVIVVQTAEDGGCHAVCLFSNF
jgi:Fibronectin type III domain